MPEPTPTSERRTCWDCRGLKHVWYVDRLGDPDKDICLTCNGLGYLVKETT